MPAKSITLHVGGGMAYRAHNARYYKTGQSPDHVDDARRGANETLVDIDHRRAYKELFSEAVADYNSRQKRADRRISDYYRQVVEDKTRHPVYEVILQVGDKDDTGLHDCEAEREVLRAYIEGWAERNPQMMLVGAYIHADETTLHAHVDFIPWADGYSRGLEKQVSISRCCEQMGFEKGTHINETSQAAWTASERLVLEELAQTHGIEVKHVRSGRIHEADKEVFIAEQRARDAKQLVAELRDEQVQLSFETYKLRAEAKGSGFEYLNSADAEALRATARQALVLESEVAELREDKRYFLEVLNSDEDLKAKFIEVANLMTELSELEADQEELGL